MDQDELIAVFDQQATGYDKQWDAMAPIRDALLRLAEVTLQGLPDNARVLSVGSGTGAEVAHFAQQFPDWSFTVVEPSMPMLQKCVERAEAGGFAERCVFHNGYMDTLPGSSERTTEAHHAVLCFLVSQFMVARDARVGFFAEISQRLVPGGILLSSDLASPSEKVDFETLLRTWMTVMGGVDPTEERLESARTAYSRDVAVIPPGDVADIIRAGGFQTSVQVFQAGLLHGWHSVRSD